MANERAAFCLIVFISVLLFASAKFLNILAVIVLFHFILQLSIYATELQATALYVEEKPGALQTGFGRVRGSLQSYVQSIKV